MGHHKRRCDAPSVCVQKPMNSLETKVLDMWTYVGWNIVGGMVPTWFAPHLVVEVAAIDADVVEEDAADLAVGAVACDDGELGLCARIADAVEADVLYALAWSEAILVVVDNLDVHQRSVGNLFDADIVEHYVLDHIVITAVDGHAALVVNLVLSLSACRV